VKEIEDLGSSYSRVKQTINVFGEHLASGAEGMKIPESFSVPDEPPAWLAKRFLESIEKEEEASDEKLRWITYSKQKSLQSAWLTKFSKQLRDFARDPSLAREHPFAEICREKGSLLVEDAKTATDFISLITDIVIDNLHTGECIGASENHRHQDKKVEEPTPNRPATPQDTSLSRAPSSAKSRHSGHMQPGYSQPEKSGRESKPAEKKTRATYMYHWLFLSFFTLTLYRSDTTDQSRSPSDTAIPLEQDNKKQAEIISEIVLCFDNANGKWIKDAFKNLDMQPSGERQLDFPCRVLPRILEALSKVYDKALWGFRVPIRNIEKV
jgi:hypothetical protein